jgi:hypothetical protein
MHHDDDILSCCARVLEQGRRRRRKKTHELGSDHRPPKGLSLIGQSNVRMGIQSGDGQSKFNSGRMITDKMEKESHS